MRKNVAYLLLLCLACFAACDRSSSLSPLFEEAERIMPQHPDSALALLGRISDPESLARKDKARYYLLRTEAQNKTYVTHTTDSLIAISTDYYEETDDPARKAKAWYYRGRINEDLGKPLKAQEYYLKALREEADMEDHALLGRVNNHIGMLYTYQSVYDQAVPYLKKADVHFQAIRDSTGQAYVLRDLGRAFLMLGHKDSAIMSNQKAITLMREELVTSVYTELASLYVEEGRMEEGYELLWTALRNETYPRDKYTSYLVLGELFQRCGQLDSARFYLQACADSAPLPATRAGGFSRLKEIAIAGEQWEQAVLLSEQYELLRDSIEKRMETESIRKIESFYSYTEMERELLSAQLDASNLKYNYSLLALALLILLSGIFLYTIYHVRQRNILLERLKESEASILKSEQIIKELSIIKDDWQKGVHAYKDNDEKLKNISCLKERLEQELEEQKNKCIALSNWKKEREGLLKQLQDTQLYHKFHSPADWEPTEEEWNALFASVDKSIPKFAIALEKLTWLNETEKKICYLTKIKVKPKAIALLLNLENISVYRKRLYEKLTNERGSAKEFDAYIDKLQ